MEHSNTAQRSQCETHRHTLSVGGQRAGFCPSGLLRPTLRLAALSLTCLLGACSSDQELPPPLPSVPPIQGLASEESAYVESLTARMQADPSDDATIIELANALDSYGRWGAAAGLYEQQTKLHPERPKPWYQLARMRTELGDREGAMLALDECLALEPPTPSGDWAPVHWRRGFLALEADRLDQAAEDFRQGRELAPGEPSPVLGLARVALQRDDPNAAIAILADLVRDNSSDPRPRGLLARAYREIGETTLATEIGRGATVEEHDLQVIDTWGATTRLAARAYEADLAKARERLAAGDADAALEALADVRREQPDNIVVVEILTHAACAAERFDEALEALAHPGLADEIARVELNRGVVAMRSGDPIKAITHLQLAVEGDPSLGLAHGMLGELLARRGRPADALAALEAARNLGVEDSRKAILIGLLHLQMQQGKAAVTALERATATYPGEPTSWANLAKAYMQLERWEDAHGALDRARSIAPSHKMIPRVAARLAELEAAGAPDE